MLSWPEQFRKGSKKANKAVLRRTSITVKIEDAGESQKIVYKSVFFFINASDLYTSQMNFIILPEIFNPPNLFPKSDESFVEMG